RLFTYLWNAEETQLTLGREIVLDRFVQDYRGEGDERVVRRLARALQIFLYREERLVWGPPLLPRRVVRRHVLHDPGVARPVVLVPCHRSHFDYLILTYIFHLNYLSPPHIAAGNNLSFWPLGPLFRGAGAFFIRRTFEDNELYKMVFRKYLTFLMREGYTQEFFIEGGRTRTGKILTPRLGMLSAIVNAFVQGVRRDLYFVPISMHYGRIPEEEAYQREGAGQEKARDALGALPRARSVLKGGYGTVYVSYADPISLNAALGAARERL